MPDGLKRYHEFEHDHFITFSCYRRLPLLNNDPARVTFETVLEACRQRYRFAVYAFVVMPEHAHLLISKPRNGTIASALNVLKTQTSRRIAAKPNRNHSADEPMGAPSVPPLGTGGWNGNLSTDELTGVPSVPLHGTGGRTTRSKSLQRQFWQTRYYDRNIFSFTEFAEKRRYIHRNPLRRRLVEELDQWPWSSYLSYVTDRPGRVTITNSYADPPS